MKGASSSTPVLILGMHRSGTSFLANLVRSLGVAIGEDLVGPQEGNPRGHFEDREILDFHLDLMRQRVASERLVFDDGMMLQRPFALDATAEETAQARDLVAARSNAGHRFWGWKEPRTCLFLDLWLPLLPDLRGIVIYRHPLEVHDSMLRRGHWDMALYPDHVLRAYQIYNELLLEKVESDPGRYLVLNANAAFRDLPALRHSLAEHLGVDARGESGEEDAVFHASEFRTLGVSGAMHALLESVTPGATRAFDRLQKLSAFPFRFGESDRDAQITRVSDTLKPLAAPMHADQRAGFIPLVEQLCLEAATSERETKRAELIESMRKRIRQTEEWNRQAEAVYEDNERLAEENERLGSLYKEQQAFLAKQKDTQAKIWSELERTGKSWEEQRALIRQQKTKIEELEARLKDAE